MRITANGEEHELIAGEFFNIAAGTEHTYVHAIFPATDPDPDRLAAVGQKTDIKFTAGH